GRRCLVPGPGLRLRSGRIRGACVARIPRRSGLSLLPVLAVIRDVESRPLEEQAGTARDLSLRHGATHRTGQFAHAIAHLAIELVEGVTVWAGKFVSWHIRTT